jgi:hypothetical protein
VEGEIIYFQNRLLGFANGSLLVLLCKFFLLYGHCLKLWQATLLALYC